MGAFCKHFKENTCSHRQVFSYRVLESLVIHANNIYALSSLSQAFDAVCESVTKREKKSVLRLQVLLCNP